MGSFVSRGQTVRKDTQVYYLTLNQAIVTGDESIEHKIKNIPDMLNQIDTIFTPDQIVDISKIINTLESQEVVELQLCLKTRDNVVAKYSLPLKTLTSFGYVIRIVVD